MRASTTLRKKIGLAIINALPPDTTVWDTELKGFCVRRQRSDAISYLLKLRRHSRIRWVTIGRHGQPWTPVTARERALAILANPALADAPAEAPAAPTTFAAVAEQFMATHGPKLKHSTSYVYQCLLRTYLIPTFGARPVDAITRANVSAAHAKWKDNPRSANHALSVLSKLMCWTEDQGYRPEDSNPCRRVQRYKESRRETFLTADQLAQLNAALDEAETKHLAGPVAIAAIRFLILTGARRNEALTLEWAWVDRDRRMIFLPDSKTGQKPIILNDAAMELLASLPRLASNPYVFPGNRNGGHLVNIQKPWNTIRKLAGLEAVRIHDLRHTFASYAVAKGGSLPQIGKALGHSQPSTTQRYAHLSDDPVRQLTEATSRAITEAMRKGSR